MTPFIAEILGTFVLILLGQGVCANCTLKNTLGNNSGWLMISFGWALAVFAGIMVSGEVSGAHLNPAVTIGLAIAGKFAWSGVGSYMLAQMIGAMLGSLTAWIAYRSHYNITEGADDILGTFSTGPAIPHTVNNVLAELIGTFVLVIAVLYAASPNFSTTPDGALPGLGAIGALPVAFIVLAIGVCLGGVTGYAINPARDLGPRIIHGILPIPNKGGGNWGYAWIPIVGPILGAVAAGLLFTALG